MKLIYAYINRFRNIINQEVSFSDRYAVKFCGSELTIDEIADDGVKDIVYGNGLISDLTIVVGKTGSGKTNLLQLIGMDEYHRLDSTEEDAYLLLYKAEDECFLLEIMNLSVMGIPDDKESHFKAYKFRYDTDSHTISDVGELTEKDKNETYILNAFDRNAFTECPVEDVHEDGFHDDSETLYRRYAPYSRANVGLVCEYIKEYINQFPHDSMKRKASMVIKANNWQGKLENELDSKLKKEYWTYADDKWEAEFSGRNIMKYKEVSPKQKFIHDLITDFAIYLRKWVNVLLTDGKLMENAGHRLFGKMPELPDGRKMPMSQRIVQLGKYIDYVADDIYPDGHGLVWQTCDDIKDLEKLLYQFDDKYFTDEKFEIPVVEMNLYRHSPFGELMERMTGYHSDEIGVFTKELLPYTFTYLSSGEYQYTKIFGLIEENAVHLKIVKQGTRYADTPQPNFILLLDEPENYMHPEMCRNFVSKMSEIVSRRNPNSELQIIMATHSPFMLSDVLSRQVIKMDFNPQGLCRISQNSGKNYFAANIFTILSDGFFLDYTIGEYARTFLTQKFNILKDLIEHRKEISETETQEIDNIKKIVPHIGDDMIRYSFENLLKQLP
jgi:predicted ATPase